MMVFLTAALLTWAWHTPNALKRLSADLPESGTSGKWLSDKVLLIAWPLAGFTFFGFIGLLVAGASLRLVRAWIGRLEGAADQKRHAAIVADLPIALALIATVVKAGRSTESAFGLVAHHLNDPLGAELRQVSNDLDRAFDPGSVWRNLESSHLGKMARTFARSAESGSGVVAAVLTAAVDVRQDRSETKRLAASRVAVKTSAPLGACFMPAFLLTGIVPMVLGIFAGGFGF